MGVCACRCAIEIEERDCTSRALESSQLEEERQRLSLSGTTNAPRLDEPRGVRVYEGNRVCVLWMARLRDAFPHPCLRGASYSRSVKEVIQPQVPLRLPCYDFAPVTALAFGRLIPCGFRHGLRALTASMA